MMFPETDCEIVTHWEGREREKHHRKDERVCFLSSQNEVFCSEESQMWRSMKYRRFVWVICIVGTMRNRKNVVSEETRGSADSFGEISSSSCNSSSRSKVADFVQRILFPFLILRQHHLLVLIDSLFPTTFPDFAVPPLGILSSLLPFASLCDAERHSMQAVCWNCLASFFARDEIDSLLDPSSAPLLRSLHAKVVSILEVVCESTTMRVCDEHNRMKSSFGGFDDLVGPLLRFCGGFVKCLEPSARLATLLRLLVGVENEWHLELPLKAVQSMLSSHPSLASAFFSGSIPFRTNKKGEPGSTWIVDVLLDLASIHERSVPLHVAVLALFSFCPVSLLQRRFSSLLHILLTSPPSFLDPSMQSTFRSFLVAWTSAVRPPPTKLYRRPRRHYRWSDYPYRNKISIPSEIAVNTLPIQLLLSRVDVLAISESDVPFHLSWIDRMDEVDSNEIAHRLVPTLIRVLRCHNSFESFFSIERCLSLIQSTTFRADRIPSVASDFGELFALRVMTEIDKKSSFLPPSRFSFFKLPRNPIFLVAEGLEDRMETDLQAEELEPERSPSPPNHAPPFPPSPHFFTVNPETVESREDISSKFVALVNNVKSGWTLDAGTTTDACSFLEKDLTGFRGFSTPQSVLVDLIPTPDQPCRGFAEHAVALLMSGNTKLVGSTLTLVNTTLGNCSSDLHFLFVESGFMALLPSALFESPSPLLDEHRVVWTNIVTWCLSCSSVSFSRHVADKENISVSTIRQTVFDKLIEPLMPFWTGVCRNRYRMMDDPESTFAGLISFLFGAAPFHEQTTQFCCRRMSAWWLRAHDDVAVRSKELLVNLLWEGLSDEIDLFFEFNPEEPNFDVVAFYFLQTMGGNISSPFVKVAPQAPIEAKQEAKDKFTVTIEKRPHLRGIGMKTMATMENVSAKAVELWSKEFGPRMCEPKALYPGSYGITVMLSDKPESEFEYWAVIPVSDDEAVIPDGMEVIYVKDQVQAEVPTTLDKLQEAYGYMYGEWAQKHPEHKLSMTLPNIEWYPPTYEETKELTVCFPLEQN
ncbi:hypothetical protein BLNAU_8136 [Blattamonas nauphoetae]|uniref:AraC effector-binding domain-containing protein n=1 Tax=Blattamonas nauphoetae TaxID=2049346 RepID=A0ABQ9XZI9_9EUKA|nr:hypothetical protein BLNAU_8136 [Blattamonas nauphoetae]